MRLAPLLLALLGLLCTVPVQGAWFRGSLSTDRNWHFLAKFAFDAGNYHPERGIEDHLGILEFTAQHAKEGTNLYAYLWPALDQSPAWPDIYQIGRNKIDTNECLKLTSYARANQVLSTNTTKLTFGENYPRYWFIVAANCYSTEGIHIDYQLHFYQTDVGWTREVSYDQQDLPALYIFYFIVFLIGVIAHGYGVWSLYRTDFLHPVVKLLSVTIFSYFLAIFCYFVHWMSFKNNGVGSHFMLGTAEFLDFATQTLFILVLLLVARGWAISTTEVTEKKIVAGFIFIFFVLYLSIFIYGWTGLDPASTLYIYETAPGIVLLVFRALAMTYFIYCLRFGVLHESHPSKRRFYQVFAAVFTAWFLSLHIIVIVAALQVPENRIRTVEPFYVTVNVLALAIMGFLFWPTQIVKYFDVRHQDGLLTGSTSSPYETL